MNQQTQSGKLLCICCLFIFSSQLVWAHNGTIGYAYPVNDIKIDGDLSDWPSGTIRYPINKIGSDTKPLNDNDFNAFFQMGYNAANRSLYLAFTITDDDFIEDTSENVRWNTQDALELYLDARHLPFGSGVASFMYSKKLRNTNNAYYDPFAKKANWDIVEVAMVKKGNQRFYEWKINLGNEFAIGKTIGLDFNAFDLDADKSFTYASWGSGDMKYVNPRSLCDVLLLPAKTQLATISGSIAWDKKVNFALPRQVRLINVKDKKLWATAGVDSTGSYSIDLPPASYKVEFAEEYFIRDKKVFSTDQKKAVIITTAVGRKTTVPVLTVSSKPEPDLIPEKGLLHHFDATAAKEIDNFITTYQKYYGVPGVSLALIKDGQLVYHKTYGVKNTFTKEPVDSNTLFEAASVTKPVFSLAVQKLAERGVIDLDKPLYLYLPYPDIAYDERYKLMTARHVLTHRTGFPNWRYMNPDGRLDLKFTPGTAYNYSGEGFEYLKMVVEKITGKKIEQVLQEEVIQPVGLWHTFFSRNDSLRRMVAEGHNDMMPNYDELPETPGMAYSMHTEAKIFTKFMLYLAEGKGLKPETYAEMFSKHSDFNYEPGDEKPKYPDYMGESFEIRETPFGKSFGHGGNNGDFKCRFEMYKDAKMGFVIFTNSNTSDALLAAMRELLVEGKDK
ncbi:MAG: serine hydrolase [Chitinophagaceae bacterium]